MNEDPKDALLRDLEDELQNLRKQLAMAEAGQSPAQVAELAERKERKKKEKKAKKEKKVSCCSCLNTNIFITQIVLGLGEGKGNKTKDASAQKDRQNSMWTM